ncbi:hypothetical protein U8591_10995 [Aquirufa antheringensis]
MKPFRKSTLIRFITLFYSPTIKNKYRRYIPLSGTRLNNEINQNYKSIIDGLIDYKLIEPGRKYSEGSHSNHYGLTDKYFNHKEIIPIAIKPKINTNIAKEKRRLKQRVVIQARLDGKVLEQTTEEKLYDRYGLLTRWFSDPRLVFNYELAQKELIKIQKSKAKKSAKAYQHAFPAVERFYRKDWSIRFDKNGRLHTNLSMLPSRFRKCITFDGKPLLGVDVSNTQPLLLASLCDTNWLYTLIKRGTIQVEEQLFKEFKAHIESNPVDLSIYKEIVKDGKFYEHMMTLYPEFSRKVIKLNILKIINDRGTSTTYNREMVRGAFIETFPTIYKLLELLKSVTYKQSSKLLMQVESSRFIVWFTQEFYYNVKNDHIPLYTIHDCFYTTPEHIDYVTTELIDYYQKYCGEFLPTKQS